MQRGCAEWLPSQEACLWVGPPNFYHASLQWKPCSSARDQKGCQIFPRNSRRPGVPLAFQFLPQPFPLERAGGKAERRPSSPHFGAQGARNWLPPPQVSSSGSSPATEQGVLDLSGLGGFKCVSRKQRGLNRVESERSLGNHVSSAQLHPPWNKRCPVGAERPSCLTCDLRISL